MFQFLQNRVQVLCAFCRSERAVYRKRRANGFDYAAALLTAVLLMYLVFGGIDPRAILFFVLFVILTESFIQLRWRMSVTCKHCGFDALLYKKDTAKAAEKVKVHLAQRRDNPDMLLSRPLHLPKRRRTPEELRTTGQNLSKEL